MVNCLFTRSGLPPVLLAGRVVIGFRPRRTPWILREHDVQHLVTPDPTPSPADQLTMDFPIPVHRHEPVRVDHHDVTGQRLMGAPASCWRHGL